MKLKIFLIIVAVIFVVFGLGFLFVPVPILTFYGVSVGVGGVFMTRLLGSTLIGLGLIYWWSRNANAAALMGVLWASVIYNAIDVVLSLMGVLGGIANTYAWLFVILHALLTLGFAYFAFGKR